MKFLLICIVLTFCGTSVLAQDKPEQGEKSGQQETPGQKVSDTHKQTEARQQGLSGGFVDENGDGVDDRMRSDLQTGDRATGGNHQLRRQHRDRFIDQDGDGINDGRCSGTGLRQGKRRGAAKGYEQ